MRAVNKGLIGLYWDIGRMIVGRQQRASWGKAVVVRLSKDLREEFPGVQGFSTQNLWYMRQFYLTYHGHAKLQPLVGEISWAKHLAILGKCKDPLEREFYIRMTWKFGWTKNVLIHQIENRSYEKTLLGQTNFDMALTPKLACNAEVCRRAATRAVAQSAMRSTSTAASTAIPRPAPWKKSSRTSAESSRTS